MANLDLQETERYNLAKERVKDCAASIENARSIISDHEGFIENYESVHSNESKFIRLCEKKLAMP